MGGRQSAMWARVRRIVGSMRHRSPCASSEGYFFTGVTEKLNLPTECVENRSCDCIRTAGVPFETLCSKVARVIRSGLLSRSSGLPRVGNVSFPTTNAREPLHHNFFIAKYYGVYCKYATWLIKQACSFLLIFLFSRTQSVSHQDAIISRSLWR